MEEAKRTLVELLAALGMTKAFTLRTVAFLKSEMEVKKMLFLLKKSLPETEEEVTEILIQTRGYR